MQQAAADQHCLAGQPAENSKTCKQQWTAATAGRQHAEQTHLTGGGAVQGELLAHTEELWLQVQLHSTGPT